MSTVSTAAWLWATRIVRLLFFTLMTAAMLLAVSTPVRGELTLTEVIENVRQNERLYENIEVVMDSTYDIGDRTPTDGSIWKEVIRKQTSTRYVSQGEWFRLEREGVSQNTQNTRSMDRIRAFDGETTRVLEQNAIGNISRKRLEDANFIRPHMLVSRHMDLPVPFSVYLSGHEAIQAHPNARWNPNLKLHVTYEGEEEYDGLNCHKISVTTLGKSGHVSSRAEFWLAEDRNYLPIKRNGYTPRFTNDIPTGQTTVSDLREIKPGIWFPFDVEITAYNKFKIRREGRQELQWRWRYVVERVKLDPQYDREFFSKVDFPDGTAMYELRNGEIVRSWRQGAPEAPGGPTARKAARRGHCAKDVRRRQRANMLIISWIGKLIPHRRSTK